MPQKNNKMPSLSSASGIAGTFTGQGGTVNVPSADRGFLYDMGMSPNSSSSNLSSNIRQTVESIPQNIGQQVSNMGNTADKYAQGIGKSVMENPFMQSTPAYQVAQGLMPPSPVQSAQDEINPPSSGMDLSPGMPAIGDIDSGISSGIGRVLGQSGVSVIPVDKGNAQYISQTFPKQKQAEKSSDVYRLAAGKGTMKWTPEERDLLSITTLAGGSYIDKIDQVLASGLDDKKKAQLLAMLAHQEGEKSNILVMYDGTKGGFSVLEFSDVGAKKGFKKLIYRAEQKGEMEKKKKIVQSAKRVR